MLYNIKLNTRKMVLVFNSTCGLAKIWLWMKVYTERNGGCMIKGLQSINRIHLFDTSPGLGKRDIRDKDHGYWSKNLVVWQLF